MLSVQFDSFSTSSGSGMQDILARTTGVDDEYWREVNACYWAELKDGWEGLVELRVFTNV